MSKTLDFASQQAGHMERARANAGRPVAGPIKMPIPGDEVTQANIVLIASKGQHGRNYLSRAARQEVFLQIPGRETLVKQDIGDVQLCRAWIMGHSIDFVKRAMDMQPETPVIKKRQYV
ncbi:MAG: hypothetical protein GY934_09685 [Gammaproteobacteria bacterium]|nr:hypothetical protein [Gammaproteobacteria bacterium]